MIREIKFGDYTAVVEVLERDATLVVWEPSLPVMLADTLDDSPGITVNGIENVGNEAGMVRMEHSLPKGELLNIICEAIGVVYDSDTVVSFPPSSSITHFVQ